MHLGKSMYRRIDARQYASRTRLERLTGVLKAVYGCSHRVTQNRSFDTEQATSSYATGFVVDDVRGIIVTNRHVVTPGTW